jgi:signal transduction histidine kinase
MRQHPSEEFARQVARSLQEGRSARAFLPLFPGLLRRHFPGGACVLYYKEAEGNTFRAYGADDGDGDLPPLREEADLVESFTSRPEAMRLGTPTRMYFELFDRDCRGLIGRLGINLIVPLRARHYFRGLLLARLEPAGERPARELEEAARTAAALFIPAIEAERMEFENDKNYYRLFKFDRLVLLGQMAASLAHELRTPLTTVLFETAAIRNLPAGAGAAESSCETISREVGRASRLIESLLVFSKFKGLQLAEVRLRDFVEETLGEIPASKIPPSVRVSVDGERELRVTSDPGRLKQVFINVFFNALEAMAGQERGDVAIRVYSEYHELPRDRRCIISISDTGPGIPDEIKTRVLEPFFTTKKDGTGLGLYISYSVMKTLKGDLEIQSSRQGTRVDLVLPER